MPRNIEIIQKQFGSDNPLPSIELADNALKLGGVEANSYALKTEVSEIDSTLEEHISDDVRHLVQSQIDKIDASINSTQAQTIAQSAVNTAKPTIEAEAVATAKTYTDSTAASTLNTAKAYTDAEIAEIDVSGKEDKSNKVTSMSALSTDTQYPSAKAVYEAISAASGGIEELTSPVRIWGLADGLYKLPENCRIYHNGSTDTVSYKSIISDGYLFVTSYSTTRKYFYCFWGDGSSGRFIMHGYTGSDYGQADSVSFPNILTNISSYVKNQLDYTTSTTNYALSAYQGYVLDQKMAIKDLKSAMYLIDGVGASLDNSTQTNIGSGYYKIYGLEVNGTTDYLFADAIVYYASLGGNSTYEISLVCGPEANQYYSPSTDSNVFKRYKYINGTWVLTVDKNITVSTTDLTDGVSPLSTGSLYFVYE